MTAKMIMPLIHILIKVLLLLRTFDQSSRSDFTDQPCELLFRACDDTSLDPGAPCDTSLWDVSPRDLLFCSTTCVVSPAWTFYDGDRKNDDGRANYRSDCLLVRSHFPRKNPSAEV